MSTYNRYFSSFVERWSQIADDSVPDHPEFKALLVRRLEEASAHDALTEEHLSSIIDTARLFLDKHKIDEADDICRLLMRTMFEFLLTEDSSGADDLVGAEVPPASPEKEPEAIGTEEIAVLPDAEGPKPPDHAEVIWDDDLGDSEPLVQDHELPDDTIQPEPSSPPDTAPNEPESAGDAELSVESAPSVDAPPQATGSPGNPGKNAPHDHGKRDSKRKHIRGNDARIDAEPGTAPILTLSSEEPPPIAPLPSLLASSPAPARNDAPAATTQTGNAHEADDPSKHVRRGRHGASSEDVPSEVVPDEGGVSSIDEPDARMQEEGIPSPDSDPEPALPMRADPPAVPHPKDSSPDDTPDADQEESEPERAPDQDDPGPDIAVESIALDTGQHPRPNMTFTHVSPADERNGRIDDSAILPFRPVTTRPAAQRAPLRSVRFEQTLEEAEAAEAEGTPTAWSVRSRDGRLRSSNALDVDMLTEQQNLVAQNVNPAIQLALSQKKYDQAAALLQHHARETGGTALADIAVEAGDRARAEGKKRASISCFLAAMKADPLHVTALLRLADSALMLKDPTTAVSYLERSAHLMRLRGNIQEALRVYQRIAAVAPYRDDVLELLMKAKTSGRLD